MRLILLSFLLAALSAAEIAPGGDPPSDRRSQAAPTPRPEMAPYPSPDDVRSAMKRAVSFARTHLSFAGGYATSWSRDLKVSRSPDKEGAALISIEEPGTPSLGLAFLRCWGVTRDPLYLQAAREAAGALLWTQLASGGWGTSHSYDLPSAHKQHYRRDLDAGDTDRGTRRALSTLDDHKSQYALLFLLELAHLPESKGDAPLQSSVKFGLDALLAAQAPNGGFPQGFSGPADPASPVLPASLPEDWPQVWPDAEYTGYYTLNDGNLRSVGALLLRAHKLYGDPRFLAAAKKLGDFLILSQCPQPQPGWAQQYNLAMEPAWARKFEPPSLSTLETMGALNTLHDIWSATGDEKFRAPFASALAWLKRSRLKEGSFARFHELHTNRPLYVTKDSYALTHDPSDLPTHYGFILDDLQEDIDSFVARATLTREQLLSQSAPPATPKAWLAKAKRSAKKVADALEGQNKEGVWTKDNVIEAALLVNHLAAFADYLEAARGAGTLFEALREKENPPRVSP